MHAAHQDARFIARRVQIARRVRKGCEMRTRMITVRGLATLAGAAAVVLFVCSGVARGDEDASKIRWDIQHYPGLVLQPGGVAFADAVDGSKIRLTGSGTFITDAHHLTGRRT